MNKWILLILSLLLLSACEKEDEPVPGPQTAEHSVMVWLAGDNNLYSEVPHKLSALAEGFRNAAPFDCRLLVYADRRGNYPQLIEITPDGNQTVLETYPAQNSASPETFSRFLNYMKETAPAKRYGLIVFSHATGWLPQGALENPSLEEKPLSRTVFDDNGEQMTLAELADALPADVKFDYIVFENCFMGGAEVAYALRDKADRLLVSSAEILSPGFEEIYSSSLYRLFAPTPDLSGFAADYYNYRNAKSGNHRSATVSVINTSAMPALTALASEIISGTSPLDEEKLKTMQRFNRHDYTLFFDLEEYLCELAPDRAKEIRTAISEAVEYAAATADFMPTYDHGFHIARHCGLTVYVPQTRFPALNTAYTETVWYKASR